MPRRNKYRDAHPEWFDEKGRPHVWVLRELLDYNSDTGELLWKKRDAKWFLGDAKSCNRWNSTYAGKSCGSSGVSGGKRYSLVGVLRTRITSLVCAYAIFHGEYFDGQLGSLDGDASNTSLKNITTGSEKKQGGNREVVLKRDLKTSKYFGVYKKRLKWAATGRVDNKSVHIGDFFSEAGAAYAYDQYVLENNMVKYTNEVSRKDAEAEEASAKSSYGLKERMRAKLEGRVSSKFKGVSRFGSRWRVTIGHSGRSNYIGTFPTEHEAADAYDAAARKHFGPDAFQNNAPRPDTIEKPRPKRRTKTFTAPADPAVVAKSTGDDF